MPRGPRDNVVAYDDKGRPIFGYDKDNVPVCFSKKAHAPESDRCMSTARMSNGRCGKHGGKTPVGIASSNFRHGKYMSNLPQRIAADLASVEEDPDYISLKAEMDLNTVHLLELMKDFDKGFDERSYEIISRYAERLEALTFSKRLANLMEAMGADDLEEAKELKEIAEKLVVAIKRGADEKRLFKEISEVSEARRKLTETEIKRIALERNHLPLDQALTVYGLIMLSIKNNVKDPVALRAIAKDVDGIVILRQIQARTQMIDSAALERRKEEAALKQNLIEEKREIRRQNLENREPRDTTELEIIRSLETPRIIDENKAARQRALLQELGLDDEDEE